MWNLCVADSLPACCEHQRERRQGFCANQEAGKDHVVGTRDLYRSAVWKAA